MILTDIQSYLPQYNKRLIKRKFRMVKRAGAKWLRTNSRILKRKAIATARRQYFITHAATDLRIAAKKNEDILFSACLLTAIFGFALTVTAANIIMQSMIGAIEIAYFTGMDSQLLILIAAIILGVSLAWPVAFAANLTSIALMEGASRKVYRSVHMTIRSSLKAASRVTAAWVSFWAALTLPVIVAAPAAFVWVQNNTLTEQQMVQSLLAATVAILAWAMYVITTYSLVPYVALFEPEMSLSRAFARSRKLVCRRGRLFILSIYLLIGTALAALQLLFQGIENVIHLEMFPFYILSALATLLIANGIMVVFYRKRKLARAN